MIRLRWSWRWPISERALVTARLQGPARAVCARRGARGRGERERPTRGGGAGGPREGGAPSGGRDPRGKGGGGGRKAPPLHLYRHLAVLAQARLAAGDRRLGELDRRDDAAR